MHVPRQLSLFVSAAAAALLVAAAAPSASAATAPTMVGALDPLTSAVLPGEAPYGPPDPISFVLVSGTISGCTPGRYFTAFATLEQDGVRLSEASGGLGADDAVCGADGTVRIVHAVYSPTVGGLPHPGPAIATLHAEDPYGAGVLVDITVPVAVPGQIGHISWRASHVTPSAAASGGPVTVPTLWVHGTVAGCTPGRSARIRVEVHQDGVALAAPPGTGTQRICPSSGVVRWWARAQPPAGGPAPHPGRVFVSLHYVEDTAAGPVDLVLASRWVVVPRHHRSSAT